MGQWRKMAFAGAFLGMAAMTPAAAASSVVRDDARMAQAGVPLSEVTAQRATVRTTKRAPTRLRVYRRPPGFPGPHATRACASWLAPEYRVSGPVVVPRMHCWWQR